MAQSNPQSPFSPPAATAILTATVRKPHSSLGLSSDDFETIHASEPLRQLPLW